MSLNIQSLSNDNLIAEYRKNVDLFKSESVREEKDRLNYLLGDLMSEIVKRGITL